MIMTSVHLALVDEMLIGEITFNIFKFQNKLL